MDVKQALESVDTKRRGGRVRIFSDEEAQMCSLLPRRCDLEGHRESTRRQLSDSHERRTHEAIIP